MELIEIIKKSSDNDFQSHITVEQIKKAKKYIINLPNTSEELMHILVSLNLINAALKRKEFKSKEKDALIHYGLLKPKVSRLLDYICTETKFNDFECQFYIDSKEQCAYIELLDLQFSFHNISITENLNEFILSEFNKPKVWRGIRLQKIAGELFDYFTIKKEV